MSGDKNALLQAALGYASRGWPVFPCNPKDKRPLTGCLKNAEGKEIPDTGGVKRATCDPTIIREWWTKWPIAGIGLACGREAGVFVLDLDIDDTQPAPEPALPALIRRLEGELECSLPLTWAVDTPRGGRHYYFQAIDGVRNRTALLGKGSHIDVRGEGGYVLLPPSKRADGKAYTWVAGCEPVLKDERPAKPPNALRDCILQLGRWELEQPAPPVGKPRPRARAALSSPATLEAGDRAFGAYAAAALAAEIHELEQAGPGERNSRLNTAALRLGELVAAGTLDQAEVFAALENAAQTNGLVKDDGIRAVRKTIMSGFRAGMKQPRDLADVRARAAERAADSSPPRDAPPPMPPEPDEPIGDFGGFFSGGSAAPDAPPVPPERDLAPARKPKLHVVGGGRGELPPGKRPAEELTRKLAFFPHTDLGNAERLKERWQHKLRWCEHIGWLEWDNRRWNREGANAQVKLAAHKTARAIQDEAKWLAGRGFDHLVPAKKMLLSELLARWGRTSEGRARLQAMPEEAAPYLAVHTSQLDTDPFKINVVNGTLVVIREGEGAPRIELRPHDPHDLITKLAPVVYDPDAACPTYDAFLEQVQPSPQVRRYLHQWGGLSLTGDTSEQVLTFNWGTGKNGKSTLFNVWGYIFGDYGRSIMIETFLDAGKPRAGGAPSPDLAALHGVRYLRTSEPERGAKLAEALIKLATGGDTMDVRHLNREFFQLVPVFKLTMFGNYRPRIEGTDEGIWRRVRLVPWTVTIPEKDRIPDFDKIKLRPEASGILNRLLAGLLDWCQHRLIEPQEVTAATAEYRRDMDQLGRFLADCAEQDPEARTQSGLVYRVFCAWCKASGENEWKQNGFSRAMTNRGFEREKSNVQYWVGLRLTKSEADFLDPKTGRPYEAKPEDEKALGEAADYVPF